MFWVLDVMCFERRPSGLQQELLLRRFSPSQLSLTPWLKVKPLCLWLDLWSEGRSKGILASTLKTWLLLCSQQHPPPPPCLLLYLLLLILSLGEEESAAFLSPEGGRAYGRVRAAAELSHQTWFPSNTLGKEKCSTVKKVNIIKIKVLKLTLITTVSFWIRRFVRAARSFHLLHCACPLTGAGVNYTWSKKANFPNVKAEPFRANVLTASLHRSSAGGRSTRLSPQSQFVRSLFRANPEMSLKRSPRQLQP